MRSAESEVMVYRIRSSLGKVALQFITEWEIKKKTDRLEGWECLQDRLMIGRGWVIICV